MQNRFYAILVLVSVVVVLYLLGVGGYLLLSFVSIIVPVLCAFFICLRGFWLLVVFQILLSAVLFLIGRFNGDVGKGEDVVVYWLMVLWNTTVSLLVFGITRFFLNLIRKSNEPRG